LANWVNDEAIGAMIHVVTRSDDHFVRVEAIGALGKLKTAKAAEAIASRLSEDWVDAPKALRNIGAAAEPALIALLTDGDPKQRRGACEVLADLGGTATFEAMLNLPPDSDPFAQRAAREAMDAIARRLGPDEVKRLQSEARKKK
jgi:HEAT repeat protein